MFRVSAWVEGTAILFAVLIVAGVGSFVDWRKEIAFIAVREKQNEKNVVSTHTALSAPPLPALNE